MTQNEWQAKAETNDKIRELAFTVTINNPLAKTAKIDETQVRNNFEVFSKYLDKVAITFLAI